MTSFLAVLALLLVLIHAAVTEDPNANHYRGVKLND